MSGQIELSSTRSMVLRDALKDAEEQRALLMTYIDKHMVKGTDFGVIPGTDKPTLLKPGAEKLVDLFRCTPKFKLMKCEEDFERGFFNYMFRVQLVSRDASAVLAEGFGSANSREGRYRWRSASRKCPTCSKETIIKGKEEYGGGWICFAKKGGCGAKFGERDPAVINQASGKVENDDVATMANTILKMAKKRALVDGSIALARCSDMFTQDVEDFAEAAAYVEETAPKQAPTTTPTTTARAVAERVAPTSVRVSPAPVAPTPTPAPTQGKRTAALSARVAQTVRARPAVIDVKPHETESQAEQRASMPPFDEPPPLSDDDYRGR